MKSLRGAVALLLLIPITFFSAAPTSANDNIPDEYLSESVALQTIVDGLIATTEAHSWVQGNSGVIGKGGSSGVCTNFDDPNCATKDAIIEHLVLSPCSAQVTENCIDGLSIGASSQTLKAATLKFETIGQRITASKVVKAPAGGGVSLWNSPEFGDFLVLARLEYQKMKSETQPRITNFSVQLIPTTYTQNPGYFAPLSYQALVGGFSSFELVNRKSVQNPSLDQANCLIITDGYCFNREDFRTDTQAKISLRLPNAVTGWLFGRMKQPTIDITPIDADNNRLTVEATSTIVPNLLGTIPKSQVMTTPSILTWAKSFFTDGDGFLEKRLAEKGFFGMVKSGVNNFWAFNLWGELFKSYGGPDKKFIINTRWIFGSSADFVASTECFKDKTKLSGLVTTNAPFYESGPPKLEDAILNYKVAGPHFLADQKTLFSGVYDLTMRSEVARCLYNFTSAPIRAEISVTSDNGSTQDVAVESMSEKNGWIHLGAYNFRFSAPTVRVKFLQDQAPKTPAPTEKPVTPTPTPTENPVTPTPTPIAKPVTPTALVKNSTITCVKGKTTKKVSGSSPKCPVGFKKK